MRLVFLSDIHGNLEALNAVREAISKEAADKVYCLGDIVGYGADPEECCKIVKGSGWENLLGNHDQCAFDDRDLVMMNPVARRAIEWTRENLSEESIAYLKSLKLEIPVSQNIVASHALPIEPEEWLYSDNPQLVMETFRKRTESTVLVGHLHYAHAWQFNEKENIFKILKTPTDFTMDDGKWIINVGSVGQPRDGDHRACYVVCDFENKTVSYKRIQYDTVTAAKKIVDAGLPDVLAHRLFSGQ